MKTIFSCIFSYMYYYWVTYLVPKNNLTEWNQDFDRILLVKNYNHL
ncbi:hypothetical protein [Flavobacterium sp. B17]|nr:hypothetical protein [Flavobacterium sp. B17]